MIQPSICWKVFFLDFVGEKAKLYLEELCSITEPINLKRIILEEVIDYKLPVHQSAFNEFMEFDADSFCEELELLHLLVFLMKNMLGCLQNTRRIFKKFSLTTRVSWAFE